MKCEEVREKLSEYLEEALDPEAAVLVREHLAGCASCREELRALDETRRAVTDLPSLHPPAGFTQRVMARVREEADRPNLFHRLFLPIHIKIPIHALALLLVGGIAVFLYRSHPPLQPVVTPPPSSEPESTARPDRSAPAAPAPGAMESFNSPAEGKLKKSVTDEIGRVPARTGELTGKLEETAGSVPAVPPRAKVAADYQLAITPQGPFIDAKVMDAKLKELAKEMGGKYIPPIPPRESIGSVERDALHRSEIALIVIPPNRYERLKTELASIGKLENEISTIPSSPDAGTAPALRSPAEKPPFLRIQLTLRPAESPHP
jgi:anti-sigma factor RsiW